MMENIGKETPQEYAQRRANETGRAYIVSGMGHAWAAFRSNVQLMRGPDFGGISATFKPQRRA
jgi:poly(3-hydroxybutyrate) depolymerase